MSDPIVVNWLRPLLSKQLLLGASGRFTVIAVADRDLPVVQCILLLVSAIMVLSNLNVDVLYGRLDPRLRQGGGGAR